MSMVALADRPALHHNSIVHPSDAGDSHTFTALRSAVGPHISDALVSGVLVGYAGADGRVLADILSFGQLVEACESISSAAEKSEGEVLTAEEDRWTDWDRQPRSELRGRKYYGFSQADTVTVADAAEPDFQSRFADLCAEAGTPREWAVETLAIYVASGAKKRDDLVTVNELMLTARLSWPAEIKRAKQDSGDADAGNPAHFWTLDDLYWSERRREPKAKPRGERFEVTLAYLIGLDNVFSEYRSCTTWQALIGTPDNGVDLVAIRHDGSRVAVQSKFYRSSNQISSHSVASTYTEVADKADEYALSPEILFVSTGPLGGVRRLSKFDVVTNTAVVGDKTIRFVDGAALEAIVEAAGYCWRSLHKGAVVTAPAINRPLRPYQVEAVESINLALECTCTDEERDETGHTHRTQCILATGTGKTRIAMEYVAKLPNELALSIFVCPTIALVGQTARNWLALERSGAPAMLGVCSEAELLTDEVGRIEEEDLAEAVRIGACITDPRRIAEWVSLNSDRRRLILVTFASLHRVIDALHGVWADAADTLPVAHAGMRVIADAFIVDEAHIGSSNPQHLTVMPSDSLPNRLFLTATPRYATHTASGAMREYGMNNPDLYGTECFRLSMAQAYHAAGGPWVAPLAVTVVENTAKMTASYSRRSDRFGFLVGESSQRHDWSAVDVTRAWSLRDVFEAHDIRSAIVFAPSVAASQAFRELYSLVDPEALVDDMDASTPAYERHRILSRLGDRSGARHVVVNCRLLGVGIDTPSLDAVVLLNSTDNAAELAQRIGRACRLDPNRPDKVARLILPTDTIARSVVGENGPMLDTIRSLMSLDAVFVDWIEDEARPKPKTSHPSMNERPASHLAHVPNFIGVWDPETGAVKGLPRTDLTKIVTYAILGRSFADSLAGLKAFAAEHGRWPRADDECADGFKVGIWLNGRRTDARSGQLSAERTGAINALGSCPSSDGLVRPALGGGPDAWIESLLAVAMFLEATGREPSKRADRDDERKLGRWLSHQRQNAKNGAMNAVRRAAADSIGITFPAAGSLKKRHATVAQMNTWFARAAALSAWASAEQRWPARVSGSEAERRAARWLDTQRTGNRLAQLSAEQTAALLSIGSFSDSNGRHRTAI